MRAAAMAGTERGSDAQPISWSKLLRARRHGILMMKTSALRTRQSVAPALQITIATLAAYSFAHFAMGHTTPVLAAITTISTLGFARDARPIRVLETALGILIGIALSEVMRLLFGAGTWQIVPFMMLAILVARCISRSNAFAIAAATQSILVLFLPDPDGGAFARSIDGTIGGLAALLATALVPRNPMRLAIADARAVFCLVDVALSDAVLATTRTDDQAAQRALDQIRATQPLLEAWQASADTAVAVARISPWYRQRRDELAQQQRVRRHVELAVRSCRVLLRRVNEHAGGAPYPTPLPQLIIDVRTVFAMIGETVITTSKPQDVVSAQRRLERLARDLNTPETASSADETPRTEESEILAAMLRPLVADLLMATGLSPFDTERRIGSDMQRQR